MAFYDPEVLTAGSAMGPARGIAEIRSMWTKYFADPGFTLSWKLNKAVVIGSGVIGYSSGTGVAAGKLARISPSGASSAPASGNC